MFTSLADAAEVLTEYTPSLQDQTVINGVANNRYRYSKTIEYRGMTEAAAVAAANNIESDIAGAIQVDGTATSPTIHVDGFASATGSVLPGIGVRFTGDDHQYHVDTLATIATNEADLVLSENYLEAGTILINGGGQTGLEVSIDGFTNANGYIRKGTVVAISGDATVYTVTDETAITGNAVTAPITPTLAASPSDGTAVTLTHPADGASVTLTASGAGGSAVRTQGPMFTFRLQVDYYDGPFAPGG